MLSDESSSGPMSVNVGTNLVINLFFIFIFVGFYSKTFV